MNRQVAILATEPTFANRRGRAFMLRSFRKNSGLDLLQALLIGTLLILLPLGSHADSDPLISVNRSIHGFNKVVDTVLLRPIAFSYNNMTPRFVKRRLNSFFNNLDDVKVTINDLLQLKFSQAGADAGRLAINTTIGLGGLFDVADPVFGLEKHQEDFGQTLGNWDIDPGAYVVLPFLGPSSVRDSFGLIVDAVFNPVQYLENHDQRNILIASEGIHDRAALIPYEWLVSGDEYLFVREAYLQRREFLVNDGWLDNAFGDFDSDNDFYFEERELELPIETAGE